MNESTLKTTPRDVRRLAPTLGCVIALTIWLGPATARATSAPTKAPTDGDVSKHREAAMGALRMANLHYQEGRFAKAAALYHDAFKTYPEAAFLFNAARAEMRDFQFDAAERDFRRYLTLPDVDDAGRRRAEVHLAEIAAYRKDAEAKEAKAKADAAAKVAARTRGKDALTIGLWVGGGGLLLTSAALYGVAYAGRVATNEQVVADANDKASHDADVARQTSLRNGAVVAALAGAGLCAWAAKRSFSGDDVGAQSAGLGHLVVLPTGDGVHIGLGGAF